MVVYIPTWHFAPKWSYAQLHNGKLVLVDLPGRSNYRGWGAGISNSNPHPSWFLTSFFAWRASPLLSVIKLGTACVQIGSITTKHGTVSLGEE